MKRFFLSAEFLALASSTLPMSALAGQGSASFQVTLKIVAPSPAPKVSQQVISATSPGYPPHQIFKGQHGVEEKPGGKFIVLTTEF